METRKTPIPSRTRANSPPRDASPLSLPASSVPYRRLATMGLIASVLALFGCDQKKIDEALKQAGETARAAWNAVKPDSQLFKGIQPGVSTEQDVRRQAGRPCVGLCRTVRPSSFQFRSAGQA